MAMPPQSSLVYSVATPWYPKEFKWSCEVGPAPAVSLQLLLLGVSHLPPCPVGPLSTVLKLALELALQTFTGQLTCDFGG